MKRTLYSGFALWMCVAGCGAEQGSTTSQRDDPAERDDAGKGSRKLDAGTQPRQSNGDDDDDGDEGQSGDDGTGDDETCERVSVEAALTTPEILIVLDRSGSMSPELNDTGTDRWAGSIDAVKQVTSTFDQEIDFGLMTFPAFDAAGQGGIEDLLAGLLGSSSCAAGTVNVEIGSQQGDAIAQQLDAMSPGGLTPTAATLDAALEVLSGPGFADQQAIAPKYVLLVTDGDPNCSSGGAGTLDPAARQQTIASIEALTTAGVQTFVVGYQTAGSTFAGQLDEMAAAGGTGQTVHQSVASGADLISTFEEIAQRVVSCSYQLEEPVRDASYVLVTVDGEGRAYGNASDGWTLGPDNRTVVLTGAACDAVQTGAGFSVEVLCEVVQVI